MSLINRLPISVTGYACVKCGKWHKKGSKIFDAHYSDTMDKDGRHRGLRSGQPPLTPMEE